MEAALQSSANHNVGPLAEMRAPAASKEIRNPQVTLKLRSLSLSLQLAGASLFISGGGGCGGGGGTFNPFNMTLMVGPLVLGLEMRQTVNAPHLSPQSSTCSLETPLSCAVGEISARQAAGSLAERRVYTDSSVDLHGDFTGTRTDGTVPRSRHLKALSDGLGCFWKWSTGLWC